MIGGVPRGGCGRPPTGPEIFAARVPEPYGQGRPQHGGPEEPLRAWEERNEHRRGPPDGWASLVILTSRRKPCCAARSFIRKWAAAWRPPAARRRVARAWP